MKNNTLYLIHNPFGMKHQYKYKVNQKIIINNRGTFELATVMKVRMRKGIDLFDIKVDTGMIYQNVNNDSSCPIFIDDEKSIKLINKILRPSDET